MMFFICLILNHCKLRSSLLRYFDLFLFLFSSSNHSYIYVYICSHYLWYKEILVFWVTKSSTSGDHGVWLVEWPMGGNFLKGKRPHVLLPNQHLTKHLTFNSKWNWILRWNLILKIQLSLVKCGLLPSILEKRSLFHLTGQVTGAVDGSLLKEKLAFKTLSLVRL